MEVKQSTQFKVPVRMRVTTTGVNQTGLTYSDVTVYIQKQAGASTQLVLSGAAQWVEVDSTNMSGVYDLLLSASDTDTTGFLKYTVQAALCNTYYGVVEIVANTHGFTWGV
jgi:hypothetical protein